MMNMGKLKKLLVLWSSNFLLLSIVLNDILIYMKLGDENVYFRYENAKNDMLKDISFRISKGEKIGIIGSSASGKTTIVNLLLRHLDPTSGVILINGIDIKEYDIESLRDIFAYTPQKTL